MTENFPANWRLIKLGSICYFERGITFPAAAKEKISTEKNIPCIRTANVQAELDISDLIYVDKSFTKNNSAKLLKADDIIFSSANSRELVGKTCYVNFIPFEMTFGGFVTVIRTKKFLSKYIFYFLRREFLFGNFMSESTQTVNIANINTSKLAKYIIPVPPLAEQKRIVEKIDLLFAKLNLAQDKLKDVLRRLELHKVYLLKKAFDGTLTAEFRTYNGISKDDWQEKTLGEICKLIQGEKLSEKKFPYLEVKYLRGVKVAKMVDSGRFISAGTKIILVDGENSGEIFTAPENGYLGSTFRALQIAENVDADFFQYFVSTKKTLYHSKKRGSAIPHLDKKLFNSTPINLPPLAEQKEIARLLDNLLTKENRVKEIAEKSLQQIDALKKNILARAFRGELGTNAPAENPVEEI